MTNGIENYRKCITRKYLLLLLLLLLLRRVLMTVMAKEGEGKRDLLVKSWIG